MSTWIVVVLNFVSALLGGFIGGWIMAYSFGKWRGAVEERFSALHEWQTKIDTRLERGDDRLIQVPVLEANLQETKRSVELLRDELKEGFAEVQHGFERGRQIFVTKDACDRQHRRGAAAAKAS